MTATSAEVHDEFRGLEGQHPKVSVVIPAYQGEQHLERLLDSLLSQDYDDYEVVVIDNNSSDGTAAILEAITDDRLRVVRNPMTLPVTDNWNFALANARGDYLKLICTDDVLTPDCLSKQAAVLDAMPGVALVSFKCDYIDDDDQLIIGSRGLVGIEGLVSAERVVQRIIRCGGNPIGGPLAGMFRRTDLERSGGFDPKYVFLGDMELWVRLLHNGDFYGVPETLGSFRVRGGSVSGLMSTRRAIAEQLGFERQLADDPRWGITVPDRIGGRVRMYESHLRRTVLFASTIWRVKRRNRGPVVPVAAMESDAYAAAGTLSTVVCAYTTLRWEAMCRAVESVLAQDFTDSDVIVVIDHCPELYRMAGDRFGPDERVTVLENTHEKGLSGARNTGVEAAGGDVVAFVDDDAVAQPGWAKALMRHYRDGRIAGVGGYADPVWADGRPDWMPREFDWVVGCSYTGQPTQLAPVRNPLGCNMSLRRSVFDVVGGFDSAVGRVGTHPVGCEETEMCIRISAHQPSSRILYDPEARVEHHVSADRATLRYFRRRCYHEGMSKAIVAELASQSTAALATERAYTLRVLPRGVARECLSMERAGLARAGVMVLGLAATTAGYVNAKVRRGRRAKGVTP